MKRLFKFVVKRHKKTCFAILLLIIVSSIASVMGTIFIKSLIDDYITPYINMANPDFGPLTNAILKMIAIYAVGVIATFSYNKLLIKVTQGSLKEIRDTMFEHMEKLPIRYFDTHNHGDIMSIYTNDTDTLRQMISQSVPQVIVSATTIVCVLVSMIVMSIPMTIISVLMVCVMLLVSKHVTNRSGRYFFAQQTNLGKVNGFIEEMMEGQKVVKVFTHEEEAKFDFDKVNEELFESAYQANKYANILMPLIGNLGYVSYVLVAVVGMQDTHLFTGTVMDNIRYGKLDATDEECIEAAKLANAHEFIMHLEHGYQTILSGDGSSLSQGQCQLLAIARAAVANPPVLILDEATSSIDTRTESIVQSGMDKLMEGRTVFVIAHRLSTIKNSDAIMVLDQGRIIERGDHDKLIKEKGTYYQLYTGGLELD